MPRNAVKRAETQKKRNGCCVFVIYFTIAKKQKAPRITAGPSVRGGGGISGAGSVQMDHGIAGMLGPLEEHNVALMSSLPVESFHVR